jgi:hypothetical protein
LDEKREHLFLSGSRQEEQENLQGGKEHLDLLGAERSNLRGAERSNLQGGGASVSVISSDEMICPSSRSETRTTS